MTVIAEEIHSLEELLETAGLRHGARAGLAFEVIDVETGKWVGYMNRDAAADFATKQLDIRARRILGIEAP